MCNRSWSLTALEVAEDIEHIFFTLQEQMGLCFNAGSLQRGTKKSSFSLYYKVWSIHYNVLAQN